MGHRENGYSKFRRIEDPNPSPESTMATQSISEPDNLQEISSIYSLQEEPQDEKSIPEVDSNIIEEGIKAIYNVKILINSYCHSLCTKDDNNNFEQCIGDCKNTFFL